MRTKCLILLLLSSLCKCYCGVTVNSRVTPMTYEDYASPVREATNAFERAIDKFDYYFEKAVDAYNNGSYETAKLYFERCRDLNNQWNRQIYNQNELYKYISICQQKIQESYNR